MTGFSAPSLQDENSSNIVCYYKLEDPGAIDKLQPELIDPTLCTHIILGFAAIVNNSLVPTQPYDVEIYQKVMALKTKRPDLKVLLAAGGADSSAEFAAVVRTAETRSSFIKQCITMLKQYKFDGFDIDWEFPVWSGDPPEDKDLFVTFLKEFREAADDVWTSPGNPFLLTADVSAIQIMILVSYNVSEMAKYVSFINIMCYDYHFYTWYNWLTGPNSPLFNRTTDYLYLATLNLAWSANYWVSKGMPKSKINVGIPTYGHTFKLLDPNWNGFAALATGPGIFGGWITYPLACTFLKNGGVEVFDDQSQVPYAYHDYDWISYDNVDSFKAKMKWVKANNFAGVMTFDLNCDDWAGMCDKKTTFPLHRALQNVQL